MAWLRFVVLTCIFCAAACDGDPCDQDEQCLSGDCSYGECGSTLVAAIVRAFDNATAEDEDSPYDDDLAYEPERVGPPRECRPYSCAVSSAEECVRRGCDLLSFGCDGLWDFDCTPPANGECTPECSARIVCSGRPTICDELDEVACLAEPACRLSR